MPIWSLRPFHIDDYRAARALWEATEGVGLDASDSRERIEVLVFRDNHEANQFWARQGAKLRDDLTLSTFTIV